MTPTAQSIAAAFRHRTDQTFRILRDEGPRRVGSRLLLATARRLDTGFERSPVFPDDVLASDISVPRRFEALPLAGDGQLTVNWVTTPPTRNSGGHTTMFRLVRSLEQAGHICRLYLYDVYGTAARDHVAEVRSAFPEVTAEVFDMADGMADAHAVFATAWATAYPVYMDPCPGRRFYLVQDFEPWFYPVGSTAALAENTYRMGFHAFTAGRFLAEKLRNEFGMAADWFDFGCDTSRYLLQGHRRRDGVVFYARPDAPRRAFELGMLALRLFAAQHPEIDIHLYGERVGDFGPRFFDHGLLDPDELNAIYNRCHAGLSLSMTNVSLVPYEMLAAGCIPVVNDATHNRIVLDNPHVRYARATPHDLARALHGIVSGTEAGDVAAAAGSVAGRSWNEAGAILERVLLRELSAERVEPEAPCGR